jgi:hypothetical protein
VVVGVVDVAVGGGVGMPGSGVVAVVVAAESWVEEEEQQQLCCWCPVCTERCGIV